MNQLGRSFIARALAMLLTALLVVACGSPAVSTTASAEPEGSDGESAEPAENGDPVELTILPASSSYISSGFIWLAEILGYYDDEGLDVTIIPSFEGAQPDVSLVEGQLDMVGGDPPTMARRLLEDPEFPTSCVATTQIWPFRVIVPADSPIQTADDLVGKLIGIPDATDEETLGLMLNFAGVDPEAVETIPTGGRAPMALAMFDGRTDASMGTHVDQIAFDNEYGADATRRIETMPLGSFNTCQLVRTEMLEEQPEVVEGLLRAMAKGATIFFEEPELALQLIGQEYPEAFESFDEALPIALATVDNHGPAYEAQFNFPEEEWQELIDKYAEVGFIPEAPDMAPMLDFSLLDAGVWDFDKEEALADARAALEQ